MAKRTMTTKTAAKTVLVVEDDDALRTVITKALCRAGYQVKSTSTLTELLAWLRQSMGHVIVADVFLPDGKSLDFMERIRALSPHIPVVAISAQSSLNTAVEAQQARVYDYIPKPFELEHLIKVVARALRHGAPTPATTPGDGAGKGRLLVGESVAMQGVYRIIARLARTDLTALICGESGTGKELVARALHDSSLRCDKPFVAVNMAALPRELIESELFGHEKGAFTGAVQAHAGRFAQARGGTLFLDEIGDMPMEAQIRLLRVLQEGEYTPVGARKNLKTDVRIIAASNQDIPSRIAKGHFRDDLYFRLNVVPLRLPPLRERLEDLPLLLSHFMARAHQEGLRAQTVSREALTVLENYAWPGNVRELENLIRRLAALYNEDVIEAFMVRRELSVDASLKPSADTSLKPSADTSLKPLADTPLQPSAASFLTTSSGHNLVDEENPSLRHALQATVQEFLALQEDSLPHGSSKNLYEHILKEVERTLIPACLHATRGNQKNAAALLGLNRNTLRKKMRDLNLDAQGNDISHK